MISLLVLDQMEQQSQHLKHICNVNNRSLSVTATTYGSATANSETFNAGAAWATAVKTAWDAKYSTGGTSGTLSLVDTATLSSATLTFAGKAGSGRRAHDMAVSISATVSGVTDTVDWMIGATDGSTDNKLQGDGIIVILKEAVAGALGVTITGTTEQLILLIYKCRRWSWTSYFNSIKYLS